MLLVRLAQNLPEYNPYKSWLIILAPALTLVIKYAWNFCSPEITFLVRRVKASNNRKKLIRRIDAALQDSCISEERKTLLREKREQVKLSLIEVRLRYLDSIKML